MKKILSIFGGIFMLFVFVSPAFAVENWILTGPYTLTFTCTSGCSGDYLHTMNVDVYSSANGHFTGTGYYNSNPAYTWDVIGDVVGDDIDFDITYTGLNSGYLVDANGSIAPDGAMSGDANSASQTFTWVMSPNAEFNRRAEITAPGDGEVVYGDVTFSAYLIDNDFDYVDWAVRKGTCAAGTNTVYGNVDGFSSSYDWVLADPYTYNFSSTTNVDSWTGGMYCFIFNPREDSGESNIRLTREFYVADAYVHGGGQIIQEIGDKPKDNHKVSFGGWLSNVGGLLMGDWEVNFHNTSKLGVNKTNFHSTSFTAFNLYNSDSDTCTDAMNFTAMGEWNGIPGYKLIMRAGDYFSPGMFTETAYDTVRFELYAPGGGKVYDTNDGDFSKESSCVGTARTGLDNGNITIWQD